MKVFQGRPNDLAGRQEKEKASYALLDRLGVTYQRTDHAPTATMEVCREIDAVLDLMICKNLFLCNRQKNRFYLLLMPADKRFRTKELSAQIGSSRLSFGSAEDMERLLNVLPGSVSIMGLMYDGEGKVSLLIDEDVLKEPFFWLSSLHQYLQYKDGHGRFYPAAVARIGTPANAGTSLTI